jgi:hypothetical protein
MKEARERVAITHSSKKLYTRINIYLITLAWERYFQRATLIPTLEGFSVAHAEKHRCLLNNYPSHVRSYYPLGATVTTHSRLNEVVYEEKIAVQFETKLFT